MTTATATPAADRPFLGILLMLGFCVLAPLGDSMAKLLGDAIPLVMLLLVRFAIQPVVLIPVTWAMGGTLAMSPRALRLTALRTLFHIIGIGAMFTSLRYLPLADAIAIAFVMPFIMLLLGHLVLGEEVGRFRILACAVGFLGTLLVIQPNFVEVGPLALLPLLVAVAFALFMLVTRAMAKEVDAVAMQAISGLMATAVLLPAMVVFSDLPAFGWVRPEGVEWAQIAALGFLGTVAHLLMTGALRHAPSATLAPMQYLEIPISTVVGWALFSDLPDGLAALGICITIGAGLTIVFRERALSRIAPPAA